MKPDLVPISDAIERTAHLTDRARTYARASRSEATLRAYAKDFGHFAQWAEAHGLDAKPASPDTVAIYLTDMAASYKPSTISRRVAAISVAHQHAGLDSPTSHATVRSVL